MTKLKIGLALGGGAARGWAHIGILDVLGKAGIVPDIVVGTSMGAVVGGCWAAERLGQLESFARELTRRRLFGYLDLNFGGSGLITGSKLTERLERELVGAEIQELPHRFVAVATEIGTGHEVWLAKGHLVEAMRASYALPGIFRPVRIANRWLFDGALVNPVPVSVCRALGARYVIAVNLNADITGKGTVVPHGHIDGGEAEAPPLASNLVDEKEGGGMRKLLQRQILGRGQDGPSISAVMVDAFNIVQDRIARSRLAGDPPDAMIAPRLGGFGLFDFHRAAELIDRGARAAEREIEEIQYELRLRSRVTERLSLPF